MLITPQIIIAHRGASGHVPENTLLSFQRAYDLGAEMIELDVHETLDGELVCIHDSTVDRTTNGSGEVHTFTYKELQKFNAGAGEIIPRLSDVLNFSFGKLQVNIELKVIGVEKKILEMVQQMDMLSEVIISSFHHGSLTSIRDMNHDVSTAMLVNKPMDDMIDYAITLAVNAINPHHQLVTPQLVSSAHQSGLMVYPWTVNDPNRMRELLSFEIDGLITDYPDRAFKILKT